MATDSNPSRPEDDDDETRTPEVSRFRTSLPAKIDGWTRFTKKERTLNDYVEDVHRMLWDESQDYQNFLLAVDDSESIEGSLGADNTMAAQMLREKATEIGNNEVSRRKLATITKALNVVMRRYHADRKRRKNTVGGEYVPPDTNGTTGE